MRTFARASFAVPLASLLLVGSAPPALAQEARFRLSLSWTFEEIEPRPGFRSNQMTLLVTLSDKGKIRESRSRDDGRRWRGRSRDREANLGEDLGGRFAGQWKVLNPSALVRVVARPSHTFAIRLRTDGSRSCTLSVEWRLKPGFTTYEGWARRRDVKMLHTQPTLQDASCEVL